MKDKKLISLEMQEALIQRARKLAEEQGLSFSALVRLALLSYIKQHEGNLQVNE